MINVLVMAGGKGERFWPKSRVHTPKQLLDLTGNGTMIQETVARIKSLTDNEHIFVVTNSALAPKIGAQLPDIHPENFIIEPEGKNTAPCIGLAALFIERKDPDGVMVVLPADHVIEKTKEFHRLLRLGQKVAENTEGMVTFGIKPDRPETGYGYIKTGQAVKQYKGVYKAERFVEKPQQEIAEEFVASSLYLWNSGMFVWKVSALRKLFALLMPELDAGLHKIKNAMGTDNYEDVLREEFRKFTSISIDHGIIEQAPEVYVLPADIGWDDVGSWTALTRLKKVDKMGNLISGANIITMDLQGCIFETQGKKLVAAIGLQDIIYVETDDVTLICSKERAQDIKLILKRLEEDGKKEFV